MERCTDRLHCIAITGGPNCPLCELDRLRAELEAANRLLDDARAQVPVAYMHNKRADVIHTSVKSLLLDFSVNYGPESMLRPIDKAEHYTIPLYAAPVPAQPEVAQVPEGMTATELMDAFDAATAKVPVGEESETRGKSVYNWRRAIVREMRAMLYAATVPAQPAAVPEAVAKDWIPHDGGLRPVDPDTKVIGLRRDGEQTITCRASFLHWEWAGFRDEGRQLVGYRILSATDTEGRKDE